MHRVDPLRSTSDHSAPPARPSVIGAPHRTDGSRSVLHLAFDVAFQSSSTDQLGSSLCTIITWYTGSRITPANQPRPIESRLSSSTDASTNTNSDWTERSPSNQDRCKQCGRPIGDIGCFGECLDGQRWIACSKLSVFDRYVFCHVTLCHIAFLQRAHTHVA